MDFTEEKLNELREHQDKVFRLLSDARDERQPLLDKVNNGENLNRKENKQNKDLATKIKVLEKLHSLILELEYTKVFGDNFKILTSSCSNEEKDKAKYILAHELGKIISDDISDLESLVKWEENEPRNAETIKAKIETELSYLHNDLENANRRGKTEDAQEIEAEIKDREDDLARVNGYLETRVSEDSILNDLSEIYAPNVSKNKKTKIKNRYVEIVQNYQADLNEQIEKLQAEVDALYKTKKNKDNEHGEDEEKEKVSFFKRHKKGSIATIAVSVALAIGIIITIKNWDKIVSLGSDNNNPGDLDPEPSYSTGVEGETHETPEIVTIYENIDMEQLSKFMNKGYSEYASVLMLTNFNENTIENILNAPYIPALENYASVKDQDINIDYLPDYENARKKYDNEASVIVDEVNRAHEIFNTKFYDEASVADIVEVLNAIDNKVLMTNSNNNVVNSINNSLNTVLNNALFGTVGDDDRSKVSTLPLFAKEGTDLHEFLVAYSGIAVDAIKEENEEAHQRMFNFLQVFTYRLFNNLSAGADKTTGDANLDESATVNNLYDWWIACNAFIKPIYTTFCPYDYSDERFRAWEELEGTMQTAMEDPSFEAICEEGPTLELTTEEGGN